MQQTLRQWLEERQANGQALSYSLTNPFAITESAQHLLARIQSGPHADELDTPVEVVSVDEIWWAYGKVAHIGRTAHVAVAYATDANAEEASQP